MEWWGYVVSGVSAVGDWLQDTFMGGSKASKLTAELNSSVEQQKALLASYEGTVQQLTSALNKKNVLPWVIGGVGVLGGLYFLTKKKGRI